jgi:hypothetical protein
MDSLNDAVMKIPRTMPANAADLNMVPAATTHKCNPRRRRRKRGHDERPDGRRH